MEDLIIEKLFAEKSKLIGSCKGEFTLSKNEIDTIIDALFIKKFLKAIKENI